MDKYPPYDPREPQQQQQQSQWQAPSYPMPPQYAPYPGQIPMMVIEPQKSWIATVLLCQFLGTLGVHRFYTGRIVSGIFQLLTFGGFGIWVLIDLVMNYTDGFKDDMNLLLTRMERVRPHLYTYPPQVKD